MPRNEEGEFELMLGNKQLLSLFFLVVVLFAVFFSLGYMVGKSVAPASTQAAQPPAAAPAGESSQPAQPSPLGEPGKPPAEAGSGEPAPVTETKPAQAQTVSAPAQEKTPEPAEPPHQAEDSAAVVARQIHLQVAAVRVKEDAEALAESLRKKGYKALMNEQTRDGWFRVVLGPYSTERAAQEMKAELEKDGYKSILKKP